MRAYEDFWVITRAFLEFALASAGVTPTPDVCEKLMAKYLDLDLYPEARQALNTVAGYMLAILSNGSLGCSMHWSGRRASRLSSAM